MAKRFEVVVYDAREAGWRVKMHWSQSRGMQMVSAGKAEALFDEEGKLAGFELKTDGRAVTQAPRPTPERFKMSLDRASESTLTLHEMELAACGRSRTLGLSKAQRLVREMRGQITEDFVELAMVKAHSFRSVAVAGCAG